MAAATAAVLQTFKKRSAIQDGKCRRGNVRLGVGVQADKRVGHPPPELHVCLSLRPPESIAGPKDI